MQKRRLAIPLSLAACAICIATIVMLVIVIIQGSAGINEGSLPSEYVDGGIDLLSPEVLMLILTTGMLGVSLFLLLFSISTPEEAPDYGETAAVASSAEADQVVADQAEADQAAADQAEADQAAAGQAVAVHDTEVELEPEETSAVKADSALESSLPKDELEIYLLIREAGGEMLQKNIVARKIFSQAKVTRLLDKLENRGLIVRERYGMTNKIRLIE